MKCKKCDGDGEVCHWYAMDDKEIIQCPDCKGKGEIMMNDKDKDYWLKEANKHLVIALIAIPDNNRVHVEKAIECLANYQQMVINERIR